MAGWCSFSPVGSHPTATAVSVAIGRRYVSDRTVGDVDGDGLRRCADRPAGTSYALYRGAATLPTTVAMTWTDATTSVRRRRLRHRPGRLLGLRGRQPRRPRFSSTAPLQVRASFRTDSPTPPNSGRGVSDHDGDGRPDFVGVNDTTGDANDSVGGKRRNHKPARGRRFAYRRQADVQRPAGALIRSGGRTSWQLMRSIAEGDVVDTQIGTAVRSFASP